MADLVKRVDYYYTEVPDRPGAGAKVMNALKAARVNLIAFNGFPTTAGRAQLDFVPSNRAAFLRAARGAKMQLVGPKTAFLFQGQDRVGIVADIVCKLGEARINVTAINGISAGRRRFAVVLWVKPRNVRRAAEVLGAV